MSTVHVFNGPGGSPWSESPSSPEPPSPPLFAADLAGERRAREREVFRRGEALSLVIASISISERKKGQLGNFDSFLCLFLAIFTSAFTLTSLISGKQNLISSGSVPHASADHEPRPHFIISLIAFLRASSNVSPSCLTIRLISYATESILERTLLASESVLLPVAMV